MAIVAASGDGNAPSTAANRLNKGGTVLGGGNVGTDSHFTNNLSVQEATSRDFSDDYGSKVVEIAGSGASTTDRWGVTRVNNAAVIAYQPDATKWIVKGGNVTETIAGIANRTFVGAAADYDGQAATRDNIHSILSTYKLGAGNGTFDVYAIPSTENKPGYTLGSGAGNSQNFVAPSGGGIHAATDDAANPSRSVPGELTYMDGSADPTTDEYQARDSANSV